MSIKVSGSALLQKNIGILSGAPGAPPIPTEFTTATLVRTIDNPNLSGRSGNDFGNSLDMYGTYAIIGAEEMTVSPSGGAGAVYIVDVTTGNVIHHIETPNPQNGGNFGHSVSIDGNYAIIGAIDEGVINQYGRAYIYNVTTGALVHTLNNPNAYSNNAIDRFGESVSISGNYAIVGAPWEDDGVNFLTGKAYIYDVTTGNLLHTLDNPNAYSTPNNDYFGESVSISGNYAIVGAYSEDDAGGADSGKAYIFDVTTGNLVHTLSNPNNFSTSAVDAFGQKVSMSGNTALVTAFGEEGISGTNSGVVYTYSTASGDWTDTTLNQSLPNPNSFSTGTDDYYGWSLDGYGNYAIVGAPREDSASASALGAAYLMDINTGTVVETLLNPNTFNNGANDRYGYATAIYANYAIVGARWADDATGTDVGKVYVYQLS